MLKNIKNHPIVKDIGFVFSGNIFNGLINFLIFLLLTNLFDVSEYGVISLFWTVIIITSTIYEFGNGRSFLLHFGKNEGQSNRIKLVNSYNYLRINTIYLFIIIFILGETLGLFNSLISFYERILIAFAVVFYLIFLHYQSIYQIEKNLKKFSLYLTLPNLLRLIFISVFIVFFINGQMADNLRTIEFLFVLALFITAFLTQIRGKNLLYGSSRANMDKELAKTIIKGAVAFGIIGIINKAGMRIDNIIIYFFLNEEGVGLFNAANNLALIFPMLTMAIITVFFREFSLNREKKNRHVKMLRKYQIWMFVPVLLLAILLFIYSQDLIIILLGERYKETAEIFRILVIPYLGGLFFTPYESFFYSYSSNFILAVKSIQFTAGIILTILFVIYFGIGGLGYSQLITRAVGWVIYSMKIYQVSTQNG